MKYFYLYIFLLAIFIIGVSYYNTFLSSPINKEGFYNSNNNSNNKSIVLLGDSILKNNTYTSNGKGIDDLLKERNNGNVYCYAEDYSKITDVYSQIDNIPPELNNPNTTIFLSSGGNDLLTYYDDRGGNLDDTTVLNPMFSGYKKVVKNINTKFPNSKLVLLDIYYPDNIRFKPYHPIISQWNSMLYNYANKNQNNVLRVSSMLTNSDDFSFGIEPSSIGGEKIANSILNYY
jgi:hypothetical protein